MIQRIQTLFLALIPIIIIVMFFFQLATFSITSSEQVTLWMTGFSSSADIQLNGPFKIWYIPAAGIILGVLSIVTIFSYKNRISQLKLCRMLSFATILFIAALFFVIDDARKHLGVEVFAYNYGSYLSLILPVLVYLASSRIKKDEAKVRAAERLR